METQTPNGGMTTNPITNATASDDVMFTRDEQEALELLRARYQQGGDQWAPRELARLDFLRWLYRSGRLES
jgi:hypothetical protein